MPENSSLTHFIHQADIAVLPVLPNTLQALKGALEKPSFNYHQLDNILQFDPACMINLLAYANQETNKDFDKEISQVEHAAMFLGMERLEKFIDNMSSLHSVANKKIADKIAQLQHRGVHAAWQAQNFAQLIDDSSADEIYTSALFTPLCELLCWYLEPVKAQKVELLIYQKKVSYKQAQHRIFGFTFHQLAEALTHHWKLPHLFLQRQEMQDLETASKAVKCLYLAEKCSILAEQGWYYDAMYEHVSLCSDNLHYSEQHIARELHKTAVYMADNASDFFPVQTTCSYLVLLPGKVPYTQVIAIKEQQNTPVKDTIQKTATRPKPTAEAKHPIVPDIKLINSASDLPRLIRFTLDALYATKAFTRVAFMILSKNKKQLQIRSLRAGSKNVFTETIVDLQPDNLFSKLLLKPQSIFINQHNYQKFAPIINTSMQNMLNVEQFIAKSVHVNGKAIGLFYMDKHSVGASDGSHSIQVGDFNQMKIIAALFDKQLQTIS